MLTANVLCIKKRKKRSYCISNISDRVPPPVKDKRSVETTVTMMHITEDTPPDMLAGAMDLTVHLPTGRSVKMSVERSTPMMDLLVQITTAHHLQLSGYIIQALGMAPSSEHSDKILPYKPSTPIGALDTQHIKVIPKGRTLPVTKNILPGRQPFESTFRLKVHLPRNQLYVCRVSRNVHLEDIMKKVCDEKNLDPLKYEFRHPGNLDEVLDPKLTLNDYQITEIHIVSKGTVTLMQAFSSSDIMALRKEEERKQMQVKTGGGVFNLIFKRGKNSMGSGSLSSENRSISPTHSDDSRSLTPPAIQQPILPPVQKNPPVERPKPPQRKRRPAPKPPQNVAEISKTPTTEKSPSEISSDSNTLKVQPKKAENELTICHSRNSSDSSGYHEASVLSDNCNTSLPRRPKSTVVNETDSSRMSGKHSKSTGNLSKFKSTSSLTLAGRKKKAAPPPPPVLKSASSVSDISKPSPVVASQPLEEQTLKKQHTEIHSMSEKVECQPSPKISVQNEAVEAKVVEPALSEIQEENEQKSVFPKPLPRSRIEKHVDVDIPKPKPRTRAPLPPLSPTPCPSECIFSSTQERDDDEESKRSFLLEEEHDVENKSEVTYVSDISSNITDFEQEQTQSHKKEDIVSDIEVNDENSKETSEISSETVDTKPPEIVAFIPKKSKISNKNLDSYTRTRGFQIGSSLLYVDQNIEDTYSLQSNDSESLQRKSSSETISLSSFNNHSDFTENDDMSNVDVELFSGSVAKRAKKKKAVLNELLGIHDLDADKKKSIKKNRSLTSLHSTDSIPSFINGNNMKKWHNCQDLDDISVISDSISLREKWSVGDTTDAESLSTAFTVQTPRESNGSIRLPSHSPSPPPSSRKSSCCGDNTFTTETVMESPMETNNLQKLSSVNDSGIDISMELKVEADLDIDWQYPLPSPPKAFRDSSPPSTTDTLNYDTRTIDDSMVTSPELFEKLKPVEDSPSEVASDITSTISEDDKQMCNKLTLEHLEKRKSLVYNRELATSLKYSEDKEENIAAKHNNVLNELENAIQNQKVSTLSRQNSHVKDTIVQSSDLPNFKITTYDNPKKKINIFEDDSVRSNEPLTESKQSSVLDDEFKSLNPSFSKKCEGNSMDNISFRKHSFDSQSEDVFKKPQDYPRHKTNLNTSSYLLGKEDSSNNVTRSESFSLNKNVSLWKPSNPVKRSKSQVAINRCQEDTRIKQNNEDNLSKSNSLYDLQSLGVIRMIQTKLNTPTNSNEELDHAPEHETTNKAETNQDVKPISSKPLVINRGPPAINLSTWSERPKKQVLLKEDNDYKINNNKDNTNFINSNNIPSNNYTKVNTSYEYSDQITTNNVTIKVNGSETISTEKTGNLVIKIGGTQNENITFRKPLGNINKIETKSRPHSIAFDSNFDISRVPIVRSVELKKPFKDNPTVNNKSSTQINSTSTNGFYSSKDGPVSFNTFADNKFAANRFSETYRSSENLNLKTEGNRSNVYINSDPANKPVVRVSSFVQNTPVVRGFRDNRKSWTPINTYGTLPLKPVNQNKTNEEDSSVVNKNVPFAQPILRKVESNRSVNLNNSGNNPIFGNVVLRNVPQKYNNEHRNSMGSITCNKINLEAVQPPPPPPPVLPKNCNFTKKPFETEVTPRDKMLSEIRNFGGKKGLKSIKA